MPEGRPAVPVPLQREVLVEAGHRCAIPTCRSVPVEIAHIVPWSTVRDHSFENLIALCPTCHTRYDNGDIDRKAMLQYKANLGLLTARYGELERRLLEWLGSNPDWSVVLPYGMDLLLMYVMQDGLVTPTEQVGGGQLIGGRPMIVGYGLTPKGKEFVARVRAAQEV